MYAVMSIIGLLSAGFIFCRRIKSSGQDDNEAILFLLTLGFGMLVGGHLLFGVTNLGKFYRFTQATTFEQWVDTIGVLFGGMVFYGGLIGAYVFGVLYARLRRLDIALYMDSSALFAPIFHGFARIGCFLGGCCYGIESSFGFCAIGNKMTDIGEIRRFPVQLLEAALNFALAFIIYLILKRGILRGKVFYIYLIAYAFIRFFDEFWRGDDIRGFIFGMSTSQFISILVLLFSVVMLLITSQNKKIPAD